MNNICPKCQTENIAISKFCKKCGSSLSAIQSANSTPHKELSDIEKRVAEEKLYEKVASDLKNGIRKEGLYAKALVDANGSVELANAIYIKYAVQSLQDDLTLQAEQERARREQDIIENQETIDQWSIAVMQKKQEEQITKERQLNDQQNPIKSPIEDDRESENWWFAGIIVFIIIVFIIIVLLAFAEIK